METGLARKDVLAPKFPRTLYAHASFGKSYWINWREQRAIYILETNLTVISIFW